MALPDRDDRRLGGGAAGRFPLRAPWALLAVAAFWAAPAGATPSGTAPAKEAAEAGAEAPPPSRGAAPSRAHDEWRILPALAYDADTGLQLGAFLQLARIEPDWPPYAYRLRAQAALSLLPGPTGLAVAWQDHFLRLDVPHLGGAHRRLFADLQFTRVGNRGYFGLGSAAPATRPWEGLTPGTPAYVAARRYHEYALAEPLARAVLLQRLAGPFEGAVGVTLSYPMVGIYPGSQLAEDAAVPPEGEVVHGLDPRLRALALLGVAVDTRDQETVPTRGVYGSLLLRGSPGAGGAYGGVTLTARTWLTVRPRRLTFALRGVFDALAGEVPLESLARYGGLAGDLGPGGGHGVRGVPAGRYHGRTKLIVNVEARSFWGEVSIFGLTFDVGTVAFVDTGRVWAGFLKGVPGLDAPGLDLAWGAGGGLRLLWGEAFVVRIDVAWSPELQQATGGFTLAVYSDAEPIL